MLARQRVERRLEHETPGGAADTRVQANRCLLLHRLPAGFGVVLIEVPAEQSLEVRHFELFDQVLVLHDGHSDVGQFDDRHDDVIDHLIDVRRDRRPGLRKKGAGLVVDPVKREASLKCRN